MDHLTPPPDWRREPRGGRGKRVTLREPRGRSNKENGFLEVQVSGIMNMVGLDGGGKGPCISPSLLLHAK